MSDTKLTVDTIAELQNEIATQREVICNLNAMNDELQAKLDKIRQIVSDWKESVEWDIEMHDTLEEITKVLE